MDPKDGEFSDRGADTIADGLRAEEIEAAELSAEQGPPKILAELADGGNSRTFDGSFRIGRGKDCELRVATDGVSREHCEVYWEDDQWRVRDLGSTNGTWLEGIRVETAPLRGRNALRLGRNGPVVWLKIGRADTRSGDQPDLDPYLERYVEGGWSDEASTHTMMVRKAFDVTRRRQRLRHLLSLAAVAMIAVVAMTAVWRWRAAQVEAARNTASDIFYSMKDLELRLGRLENRLGAGALESQQLESGRDRMVALSSSYDRYLQELDLIGEDTPEDVVLILRVARVFGECEIGMPPSLVDEVNRYIEKWRDGTRLQKAVERARKGGYAGRVAAAFDRVHLPPQYYYVALQESDFRVDVCGPKTRYGIAKGAWQFIPGTGRAYGLRIGPLYLEPRHDPEDERHDFDRASDAAARYIRDIYLREAQGSGLLVLAIYNYGGTNVRRLIRSLPESPRERNFWQVLLEHRDRFPKETYDYVLKIFSAAVIGENPQLFGFDFAPPLADVRAPAS
jgi:hypothetical protein